jgi:hypothetical protein
VIDVLPSEKVYEKILKKLLNVKQISRAAPPTSSEFIDLLENSLHFCGILRTFFCAMQEDDES